MKQTETLCLRMYCPVKAQNAGLCISRGTAMHPTRIIQSHELIFVKQGELDMWEEDRTFHLEAGYTLHLWPGRVHGSTKPMPLGLKFYWIHFEVDDGELGNGSGGRDPLHPPLFLQQVKRIGQPERLERLFRTFLEDQETGMLQPHSANLLTMLLLDEVAHSTEAGEDNSADQNAVASWAHTFIRINFDRPITASAVAEAVGYNADYLSRIYRKVYGCPLSEAIHRRRVSVACDYLLDTSLTIEQIAQRCGFTDPDYFRRVFRHHMHISPGDYRREYSRMHVNTD